MGLEDVWPIIELRRWWAGGQNMSRDEREYQAAEIAKRQYFLSRGLVLRQPDEDLVTEQWAEDLQRWYQLVTYPTRHV